MIIRYTSRGNSRRTRGVGCPTRSNDLDITQDEVIGYFGISLVLR